MIILAQKGGNGIETTVAVNIGDSKFAVVVFPLTARGYFLGGVPMLHHFAAGLSG